MTERDPDKDPPGSAKRRLQEGAEWADMINSYGGAFTLVTGIPVSTVLLWLIGQAATLLKAFFLAAPLTLAIAAITFLAARGWFYNWYIGTAVPVFLLFCATVVAGIPIEPGEGVGRGIDGTSPPVGNPADMVLFAGYLLMAWVGTFGIPAIMLSTVVGITAGALASKRMDD